MTVTDYFLAYDAFLRSVRQNKDVAHVVLLGAGASISSGVKPASDCIWEWKRDIFISKNPNLAAQYQEYKVEAVRNSIQRWLDNEGCYPPQNDPEEYSKFALLAYPIEAVRRKYFDNICHNKEPSIGYRLLCLLAKFGTVPFVFTTNFDGLVVRSAHQMGITPIEVTLDTADRVYRPSNSNELVCVELHGDFKYGPLKNTDQELDSQNGTFIDALSHHLFDKHLIVLGYSGRDTSLMNALSKAYEKKGSGMLFWCGYGDELRPEVYNLIMAARKAGRGAFYIPTEGFDPTLIHLAKMCFEGEKQYKTEAEQALRTTSTDKQEKTPFAMDVKHTNSVIRSNLFFLSHPREVFQFELRFGPGENAWQTIKALTRNSMVVAVQLKQMTYAFGTLTEIHNVFQKRLISEISRTPVTRDEIRFGNVFKSLYREAVIRGISQIYDLATDGYARIWKETDKETFSVGQEKIAIFEAAEVSLFFDRKFVYLSLQPTFQFVDSKHVSRELIKEIGRQYYQDVFKTQANLNFDSFLLKWKRLLFPGGKNLEFDYPYQSASGFKFVVGSDTMHVNLMRARTDDGMKQLPRSFNSGLLRHSGIQYLEPQLEFVSKDTGRVTKDFHPMRGLINNCPYDFPLNGIIFDAEINLGVICPSSFARKLFDFLNRLNQSQSAGRYNPDYLFDYPGFLDAYNIPLNVPHAQSERWQDCDLSLNGNSLKRTAQQLLEIIKKRIDRLEMISKKLVIVILVPTSWNSFTKIDDGQEHFDLHDHIKAYAAQKSIGTQFIREDTLSDPLTCQVTWWLSLSFYVKALRTPWLLAESKPNTAFVGIGYSVNRYLPREKVVVGCSHIYNAQGQGLKYKLSKVNDCYFDRKNNPFLSYEEAYKFAVLVRDLFFTTMGDLPQRVVVHKRTHFKRAEIEGIVNGLKRCGIQEIDLVEISFEENARFIALRLKEERFEADPFPLSRGTCFLVDDESAMLWTHGIVPSAKSQFRKYYLGGKNIPTPLKITKHYGASNISTIGTEILGLTKMNWNSFNLYSKLPATIQTSSEIARIGWLLSRFEGNTYDYRNFM